VIESSSAAWISVPIGSVRLAALEVLLALTDGITGSATEPVVSGVARSVVSLVRAVSADCARAESFAGAVVSALVGRLVSGLLVLVDSALVSSALATVSGTEEERSVSDRSGVGAAVAIVVESPFFAELAASIEVSCTPPGA
jgi:hypothetical protein